MLQLLTNMHTHVNTHTGVYSFLKGMIYKVKWGLWAGGSTMLLGMSISLLFSWVKFPYCEFVWAKFYSVKYFVMQG